MFNVSLGEIEGVTSAIWLPENEISMKRKRQKRKTPADNRETHKAYRLAAANLTCGWRPSAGFAKIPALAKSESSGGLQWRRRNEMHRLSRSIRLNLSFLAACRVHQRRRRGVWI